ncbi:MAG: choice-of-anchor D domain-containing protein, partial [Patescibacteria group bacterium]
TVTAVSSNNSVFTLAPAIPPNVGVNVGDSVAVTVSFTPLAAGATSGNITITHDGVNSPAAVTVAGNGVVSGGGGSGGGPSPPLPSPPVPGITLLPASLVMDSVIVGGPGSYKTFEIRNDSTITLNISSISVGGENASEFLVSMNSAVIEAGGSRIVVVSFLPVTADSAKSAVVNISHNAPGGISTVPLTGVAAPFLPGTSGAAISITPQSVVFDTVGVGSSRTIDVTVSNPGTAPLVVYGIALGGEDPSHFSLSRDDLRVDPGSSRFINVTFRPASVGPKSAVLVLANNTANPALAVPLSGTTPVFFAPPQVNISADRPEGPAPLTVRFSNTNSGGFATYWDWKPGDRDEAGRQVSIIRHTNGDTLTYTYNQPGVYRPILTVFGPGGGDAQNLADSIVVLVPTPLAPILRVDSDSLQFGAIDVGGGIISSFQIFNSGTAGLNGRIMLDGDNSFSVTSADSFSIL